ncbi:uncharacterized protein LOC108115747 [Drosophila eugracilis]|uniref:uncharacterized protein LOC108115747 n=1 Tax=Drosophila eugracilis TaxID=29029 RepID=UPI001BDA122F|nr:uncharacterized protein LOC108115747 [Drosophila eugracilis]
MGACPGQPCFGFGAQLKRYGTQVKSHQRQESPVVLAGCDGLTHLPGQQRQPSSQRSCHGGGGCHINQP